MRITSVRLFNFRQHIDTRIDFDAGITGIIGPNGSGKSTILEAIAWVLYGMPAARGTRESIRAYRAPPRAQVRVELEFELGGHRYFVSRGLTGAEVHLDGAPAPVANTITGATEFLRRRLGMSQQEFFNTYFTGQKELSVMAAMGPAERGQFLSRVLGYERLRTAQGLVRDRRKVILAEIAGLRAVLPDPVAVGHALSAAQSRVADVTHAAAAAATRRTAARGALDALAPRWEAIQRERDVALALVAEIRIAEGERASAEREIARLDGELAEVAVAREELARLAAELAPQPSLEAELRELERSSHEDARRRDLINNEHSLTEELTGLRERKTKIETAAAVVADARPALERTRTEKDQTQQSLLTARAEWERDKQEVETKLKDLRTQLREAEQHRNQIIELGENGTCPICERPLRTHFRTVLDLFENQIESITDNGKYYRKRKEQLEPEPAAISALDARYRAADADVSKLGQQLARAEEAAKQLSVLSRDVGAKEERHAAVTAELAALAVHYDAVRHADVRAAVARLAPLATRHAKLSTQLEREGALLADRDRSRTAFSQVELRIADLVAKRDATAFSEQAFGELRGRHDAATDELRAAELAAVSAEGDLANAQDALAAATRASGDLERGLAQVAALDRDRRLHDELDRAFGDLRTELNQELRPEISDRASQYIRDLTDGRYSGVDLDDQYNVTMMEDAVPKPVISGGEEDLANLVLRLAISEMIAERAGQPFSLLILDEVFGSLDEGRRHNVVDLLRRLQDRFEQVILITHIDSVREGLDRVVSLRYEEEAGVSRVNTEVPATEPVPGGVMDMQLDLQAGAAD